MKCTNCKGNLGKDSKFCPECGTAVPKLVPKLEYKVKEFPPILDIKLAAEFLIISRAQLYILINTEDLPWFPMGTHKRFLVEELIAWSKRRMRGGSNIAS